MHFEWSANDECCVYPARRRIQSRNKRKKPLLYLIKSRKNVQATV